MELPKTHYHYCTQILCRRVQLLLHSRLYMTSDSTHVSHEWHRPGVRLLQCEKCGHSIACTPKELVHFAISKNWRRCCGKVMSFSTHPQATELPPKWPSGHRRR